MQLAGHHVTWTLALRWTARVWSIVSVALILGFIIGEGINPAQANVGLAPFIVGFVFFPVGVCVGMILAWWDERAGGIVTVGSLVAFYGIHQMTAGALPAGWAWLAFAAPGFLFLLASYLSRPTRHVPA